MTLLLISIFAVQLMAQDDSTKIKVFDKNIVTVVDDGKGTQVKVGNDNGIEVVTDDWGDTTKVRIGSRTFKVVDDYNGTHIRVEREPRDKKWTGHFNAHWAGLEWGVNILQKTDYSLYDSDQFMDLNHGKSITLNLNFAEWAFKNEANNFALVTGFGFSFMDFAFDNPITIEKYNGKIVPININPNGLKKSKLNITYLTAPLILELKTPLRLDGKRVYLGAGIIGGLNIGSHTKYKYKQDKFKDKSNYYINQFKCDITGRIGFGDFCIFANYSMTPLFKENKGPEMYPLTVGFSFPNL
jgi:hypothetical protein